MDDVEIAPAFHACFYEYGGLSLTPMDEIDHFRQRYLRYMHNYRTEAPYATAFSSTFFHMIRNKALGAACGRHDGYDLVGLYDGAVMNIVAFTQTLLAHPLSFKGIGNRETETPWWMLMDRADWTLPLRHVLPTIRAIAKPPDEYPCDPIRRSFAEDIATFALDFLFFHELGHVIYGHGDFLEQEFGVYQLSERKAVSGLSPDLAKMLELSADVFAIEQTGRPWLHGNQGTKFASSAEALVRWCTALNLLLMISDASEAPIARYESAGHPHPAVRHVAAYGYMSKHAHVCGARIMKNFDDAWLIALEEMGEIAEHFGLRSAIWAAISRDGRKILWEQERLSELWSSKYQTAFDHYSRIRPA